MAICEACREQMDAVGRTKVIRRGPLAVYPARQIATWHDREVRLTPTLAAILATIARTGEASNEQLLTHTGPLALRPHMRFLRQALAAAGAPDIIISRHGWGYVLDVGAGDANA